MICLLGFSHVIVLTYHRVLTLVRILYFTVFPVVIRIKAHPACVFYPAELVEPCRILFCLAERVVCRLESLIVQIGYLPAVQKQLYFND